MTDIRDAEPHPPDDSGGFCCVSAGMHMGHDEDCRIMHLGVPGCPECEGRGWTEYESGVIAPNGAHEWLKEPCGMCNKDGRE